MTDAEIVAMLRRYKDGRLSEREAVAYLEKSSVEKLGFAEVDHARERRQGFPEVIYGEGKTGEQVLAIMESLAKSSAGSVMATRMSAEKAAFVQERLPEAELDVMLALWTHTQPVRTARLLEDLADKAWSLSTLKVLLGRLADKSFVEVTREGRFTLYRARVREEDYRRMETNGLLRRYYKNSVAGMVAALVQDEALTGSELAELKELLRKAGEPGAE